MRHFFSKKKPPPSHRTISLGPPNQLPVSGSPLSTPQQNQKFATNRITTAKYTLLTFVPKNLFEQFRRMANLYFLAVAIVHLNIESPISPATSILPLIFVVGVTGIKQGYEDFQRHKEDNKVNSAPARVLTDGKVKEIKSEDIKVGDIIQVPIDEQFPCDLLLLMTCDGSTTCAVTTANLDGETNAKKFEVPMIAQHVEDEGQLSDFAAIIQAQAPHPNLYDFKGRCESIIDGQEQSCSLSTQHLLLRGATLVDQDYISGVAVYTGKETKLALNLKMKTNKFSTIEHSMNRYLMMYLLMLFTWIVITTVLKYTLYGTSVLELMWYIGEEAAADSAIDLDTVLQDSFSCFILYSYLIPISLYVTLELQKFGGSLFFEWDELLRDGEDGEPAKCNTSDLNEELGQIEYLFCDKTGTLTENKMTFNRCSIGARSFVEQNGQLFEHVEQPTHDTANLLPVEQLSDEMVEFFTVICLCNTVHTTEHALDDQFPDTDTKYRGELRKSFSNKSARKGKYDSANHVMLSAGESVRRYSAGRDSARRRHYDSDNRGPSNSDRRDCEDPTVNLHYDSEDSMGDSVRGSVARSSKDSDIYHPDDCDNHFGDSVGEFGRTDRDNSRHRSGKDSASRHFENCDKNSIENVGKSGRASVIESEKILNNVHGKHAGENNLNKPVMQSSNKVDNNSDSKYVNKSVANKNAKVNCYSIKRIGSFHEGNIRSKSVTSLKGDPSSGEQESGSGCFVNNSFEDEFSRGNPLRSPSGTGGIVRQNSRYRNKGIRNDHSEHLNKNDNRIGLGDRNFCDSSENSGINYPNSRRNVQTESSGDEIIGSSGKNEISYDNCSVQSRKVVRRYHASSPDEKALVEAASRFGIELLGTENNVVSLNVLGGAKTFTILKTLQFDSDRRKMSVVVRTGTGVLWVLCKGADIAVLPICVNADNSYGQATQRHLDNFATAGLRTLAVAMRSLTEEELLQLDANLHRASQSLEDREGELLRVYSTVETNMTLLGATAVQDTLQRDVPRTLSDLGDAGIKMWVLTGDKLETAVTVSLQCGHFTPSMEELTITGATDAASALHLLSQAEADCTRPDKDYRLVVDGASLAHMLEKQHKKRFRALCVRCSAVLCCRLSPKQKAEVVRLVKSLPSSPKCAAIGDGANDVSMIQEAHVGIGIMGSEGRQAVRSADFGISQFSFLRRLFLVHGRWFYIRVALLVHYSFYKNVAFIAAQFFFAFFSAFSTQTVYGGWYLTFYNTIYVSLPVLVYGLMEQDIDDKTLLGIPHLYRDITRDARMTWGVFMWWMLLALYQGSVMFFGMQLIVLGDVGILSSGQTVDISLFGTMVVTICVTVVNLKILLETRHMDALIIGSVVLSLAGYVAVLFLYNCAFPMGDVFGDVLVMMGSPLLLLALLLLTVLCLIPDCIKLSWDLMMNGHQTLQNGDVQTTPSQDVPLQELEPVLTFT